MKLRTKIISGFAVVAVIGCVLGAVGLLSTRAMARLSVEQSVVRQSVEDTTDVLTAHYEWRHSLTVAVYTHAQFTGAIDPTTCALGRWLGSDSSNTDDATILRLIDEVQGPHTQIHTLAHEINEQLRAGQYDLAVRTFTESVQPLTDQTIQLLNSIEDRYADILEEMMDDMAAVQRTATILIVAALVIGLGLCVVLAVAILRSIMRPVRAVANSAQRLATGALDVDIDYTADDELGQLRQAFLALAESMQQQSQVLTQLAGGDYTVSIPVRGEQDVVNRSINDLCHQSNQALLRVRVASDQVSVASRQVATAAQSLANGASEQSATLSEFTDSLAEMQNLSQENAALSEEALRDNREAGRLIDSNMRSMDEMIEAMRSIDENAGSITRVIKVIDDIAFQTNILALNAAVEAARAGQHGKGFAVVADEVRNLASKSAEAARETAELIQRSTGSVQQGNRIVAAVGEGLQGITATSQKLVTSIERMNAASTRQSEAVAAVNTGVNQLGAVVQQAAAIAEQTAASAEEMSSQAVDLDEIVGEFRLSAGQPTPQAPGLTPPPLPPPEPDSRRDGYTVPESDKYAM